MMASSSDKMNQARPRGGSSLLLVLWAIMLMSFAVIGLISHLSRGLEESIYAEKEFRARLLLQSAQTLAMHPDIAWGDPLLRQHVSSASSYEVDLSTEGTRLAVNLLATSAIHRQSRTRGAIGSTPGANFGSFKSCGPQASPDVPPIDAATPEIRIVA